MTQKPFLLATRLPNTNREDDVCHHPMIQFFIHYNTYGTVWYRGQWFNLKDRVDHDVLRMWMVADGLISFTDEVIQYPYNSGYDTQEVFTVHHKDYTYIRHEAERFFWYNLLDRLLPQLNDEELAQFNADRKENYNAILLCQNHSHL